MGAQMGAQLGAQMGAQMGAHPKWVRKKIFLVPTLHTYGGFRWLLTISRPLSSTPLKRNSNFQGSSPWFFSVFKMWDGIIGRYQKFLDTLRACHSKRSSEASTEHATLSLMGRIKLLIKWLKVDGTAKQHCTHSFSFYLTYLIEILKRKCL